MPNDFKKEWMNKSSIDYFSPFISLWLACNSWYMHHYADLHDSHPDDRQAPDREFINKIKTDTSGRNHLFTKFGSLIDDQGKDGISFRTNIELLHYALDRANLQPERIRSCSFLQAVLDYNNNTVCTNLVESPRINANGDVHASDADSVVKLDKIYITSDKNNFFAGLFEIMYQVRNMLVHGNLNPDKDEHDVVKYCYCILWEIMP